MLMVPFFLLAGFSFYYFIRPPTHTGTQSSEEGNGNLSIAPNQEAKPPNV